MQLSIQSTKKGLVSRLPHQGRAALLNAGYSRRRCYINLRDGVLAVRQRIGELQPWFWSDAEIIQELNTSARRMTSAAQSLQSVATFTATKAADGGWNQEYALPLDVDQI